MQAYYLKNLGIFQDFLVKYKGSCPSVVSFCKGGGRPVAAVALLLFILSRCGCRKEPGSVYFLPPAYRIINGFTQ